MNEYVVMIGDRSIGTIGVDRASMKLGKVADKDIRAVFCKRIG